MNMKDVPYYIFDWEDSGVKWAYVFGMYFVDPRYLDEFLYQRELLSEKITK